MQAAVHVVVNTQCLQCPDRGVSVAFATEFVQIWQVVPITRSTYIKKLNFPWGEGGVTHVFFIGKT